MILTIRNKLFTIITAVFILSLHSQYVYAGIVDSKHNMSLTGSSSVKATTESQICVFCHTPHKALSDAPLWNRSMSSATYQMFNSDTFLSYDPALQPDGDSKLCLSCHDGTIAIGSVVNIGGVPSTISMQGGGAGGELPPSSSAYVGTDLSGHHPVSIELNATLLVDKNTQCTDGVVTWKLCIPTAGAAVKLQTTDNTYPYGGVPPRQGVQCTSCHDPHKDPDPPNTAFLRVGDRVDTTVLCTSCHTDCFAVCP